MTYSILLYLHVIGATILFGTGIGIAFFMVMSNRSGDARLVAHVAGIVVVADTVFTATAAVLQPLTGVLLAREAGWPLLSGWVGWSLVLYLLIGTCWLPVVWIQLRMRNLAIAARDAGTPLPLACHRLYRWWFALGFPAFAAVLTIFWLMLTKPVL
jgi:uncharacterized membrane protein